MSESKFPKLDFESIRISISISFFTFMQFTSSPFNFLAITQQTKTPNYYHQIQVISWYILEFPHGDDLFPLAYKLMRVVKYYLFWVLTGLEEISVVASES